MTSIQSVVRGVGAYLPEKVLTNQDLTKIVDTTDEWIVQRTGIRERHVIGEDQNTSDMAVKAAEIALQKAGKTAADVDLIVVATTTPDYTFPATAALVQQKLGVKQGLAFDIQAVCSGFVYAVATVDSYLKNNMAKCALVIGADCMTRILDWEDRATCVLFADGAGAMVLEASEVADDKADVGVLASSLRSDGTHWDKLYVDGGVSKSGNSGFIRMEGREVFKHAVNMISSIVLETLDKTIHEADDVDWFVPHQANKRIIDGVERKLGLSADRVVVTVDKHANTSAASVPLALYTAIEDGRIKSGDLVMIEAMGGGFTWGASLIRW